MSILSSIGSAVKSAYNTVSSVYNAAYNLGSNIGSTIKNAFSGSSNTASVANAVPSSSNTTPATQTKTINTQSSSQNTQSSGPVTISSSSSNYSPLTGYASNPVSMNTTTVAPKTLNSSNIKTSSPVIPTTINSNLYPTTNSNYYGSSTGNVVAPQGVKTLTTGGMSSDQQGSSSIATGTQNGNKLQFDKNGVQKPQTMEEIIAQQKALYPDSVDYATMYKEAQNQTGVIEKQNIVNNLTNQLNSINSETETALSRLRGVGAKEGVTEFVYGQQSAEILREGQMRASPIQAQLQAAQGDLQSAQNTLDTLYKLKVQTAEQNYKKWTNIVDTSRDIFDKQQQKLIDDKKTVFANNSKRLSDSVNFAQQLAVKLLETKPNLSQQISSLREPDTMSPTFNEDLQAYNQQIAKYAGQAGVSTDGQTGVSTGTELSNMAQIDPMSNSILAQTGLSIPAFGFLTQGTTALTRLSSAERQKYMKEAETWANKKGIDISAFKSQYEAYNTALQNNIKRFNNTQIMEGELLGTIDNLSQVADSKSFGKLKVANVAKLFAGEQVNDPTTLQYAVHLNQLVSELAGYNAAVQGRTSTDLIDIEEAKRVIKNGLSSKSLAGFNDAIKSSVTKMSKTLQESVDRTQGQVWKLFGVKKPQATQSSQLPQNDSTNIDYTKTLDNIFNK